jgi:hypothetical protein
VPSILDPSFVYTSAAKTDIRQTFARVRAELAAASVEQIEAAPAPRDDRPEWLQALNADERADLERVRLARHEQDWNRGYFDRDDFDARR